MACIPTWISHDLTDLTFASWGWRPAFENRQVQRGAAVWTWPGHCDFPAGQTAVTDPAVPTGKIPCAHPTGLTQICVCRTLGTGQNHSWTSVHSWWLSDLRKNWVHYGSKSSRIITSSPPGNPKMIKNGVPDPYSNSGESNSQTAKPRTFQQDCSLALHVVSDLSCPFCLTGKKDIAPRDFEHF